MYATLSVARATSFIPTSSPRCSFLQRVPIKEEEQRNTGCKAQWKQSVLLRVPVLMRIRPGRNPVGSHLKDHYLLFGPGRVRVRLGSAGLGSTRLVSVQLGWIRAGSSKYLTLQYFKKIEKNIGGGRVREPVWLVSRGTSVRIRFGSPFSSKVVVCGHCRVTLSITIMKDKNGSHRCPS